MNPVSIRKPVVWARRMIAAGLMLGYLGAGAFFLYCHLLGETRGLPWAYYWTWDMFPNYPSFSARRLALGETQSGRFVQVFPANKIRYRRGGSGDLTRYDLPRNDAALKTVVAETLQEFPPAEEDDPVKYVFLVEEYWPVKFNLPDDLYEESYGEENPRRHSFRIIDEGPVDKAGEIGWVSRQ